MSPFAKKIMWNVIFSVKHMSKHQLIDGMVALTESWTLFLWLTHQGGEYTVFWMCNGKVKISPSQLEFLRRLSAPCVKYLSVVYHNNRTLSLIAPLIKAMMSAIGEGCSVRVSRQLSMTQEVQMEIDENTILFLFRHIPQIIVVNKGYGKAFETMCLNDQF